MNFEQRDYLPNAEERVKHLQDIVAGRPVAILATGPSIYTLEERIEELRDVDICYFGMNNYTVQETAILNKIDKKFSVIMCSAREGIADIMGDIVAFLDRKEDNMFISSFWRNTFALVPKFDLEQFFIKYGRKFIFFSLDFERTAPNNMRPLHFIISNSLLVLIQMAVIAKASSIVLFGADGGAPQDSTEWFYRQDDLGYRSVTAGNFIMDAKKDILKDTLTFFNPIASTALNNLYKTYGFAPTKILNCSENSFYTTITKVSYDTTFNHLLRKEI